MGFTITVRGLELSDKSWLQREARQLGISTEEFVRRLVRERRECAQRRTDPPSAVFRRYFGPEHGVEFRARHRHGYRPTEFESGDDE